MLLPAVILLIKISKVRKIEFLQFLQKFTPPLWESQIFEKKFHFRGRSTSELAPNSEEIWSFDTLSVAFSNSHFFELFVTFFPQFS